jgi:hypothetical protein
MTIINIVKLRTLLNYIWKRTQVWSRGHTGNVLAGETLARVRIPPLPLKNSADKRFNSVRLHRFTPVTTGSVPA